MPVRMTVWTAGIALRRDSCVCSAKMRICMTIKAFV